MARKRRIIEHGGEPELILDIISPLDAQTSLRPHSRRSVHLFVFLNNPEVAFLFALELLAHVKHKFPDTFQDAVMISTNTLPKCEFEPVLRGRTGIRVERMSNNKNLLFFGADPEGWVAPLTVTTVPSSTAPPPTLTLLENGTVVSSTASTDPVGSGTTAYAGDTAESMAITSGNTQGVVSTACFALPSDLTTTHFMALTWALIFFWHTVLQRGDCGCCSSLCCCAGDGVTSFCPLSVRLVPPLRPPTKHHLC